MTAPDPQQGVDQLLEDLRRLVDWLQANGAGGWGDFLERDADKIARHDAEGLRHLLSADALIGSFNDLTMPPELEATRSRVWENGKALLQDPAWGQPQS